MHKKKKRIGPYMAASIELSPKQLNSTFLDFKRMPTYTILLSVMHDKYM
jgi:hypothetical protein